MYRRISRLHVFRTALALALLAGFLATPLGIAHAGHAEPESSDAPLLRQDPDGPRMESSGRRDGHGRCFTCHWFQGLRSALVSACVAIPEAGEASPFSIDGPFVVAAGASLPSGARAPPA